MSVAIQWTANENLSGTVELVKNGVVVASVDESAGPGAPATLTATVGFTNSGWLAARIMGPDGHQVHTAAVFVTVGGAPVRASIEDAQFYVQWMDTLLAKTSPGGEWNHFFPTGLAAAQARYQAARAVYQQIALEAGGSAGAPTVTSVSPTNGATNVSAGTAVTATFSEAMAQATISGTTFDLRDSSNQLVQATVAYNGTAKRATLTPSSPLANSTTYTARVVRWSRWGHRCSRYSSGDDLLVVLHHRRPHPHLRDLRHHHPGRQRRRRYRHPLRAASRTVTADATGAYSFTGLLNGSYTVTPTKSGFTLSPPSAPATIANADVTALNFTASAAAASQSLFTTQTPAILNARDGVSVNYELGMSFTSTVAGQITHVRFWKASSESGTHTGRIWSGTGTLLASVVFTGETASGWQQQALATPLAIAANTTYVVSVNTGNAYYVATNSGLATQITNQNLRSVVGTNGRYGTSGTFPTGSWQASNYFRDVVFSAGG